MRNDALISARLSEDNAIRPWTSARVRLVATEDGEFVVRAGAGKVEAFVVVVDVGIFIRTDGLAFFEVVAALGDGFVDVGLPVARRAACVDALALNTGEWMQFNLLFGCTNAFNASKRVA